MKLSVLTVPLYDRSLEEALAYLHGLGVQAVELGCGGCPGKTHLDPEVYLNNPEKIAELKELLKNHTALQYDFFFIFTFTIIVSYAIMKKMLQKGVFL